MEVITEGAFTYRDKPIHWMLYQPNLASDPFNPWYGLTWEWDGKRYGVAIGFGVIEPDTDQQRYIDFITESMDRYLNG